jgi:hypothetical protein
MLEWLIKWYKSNCNGDWEHSFGVHITTIDNPGWYITIDLKDTPLEKKTFQRIEIDNGDNDWIHCYVKDNIFIATGDPDKLQQLLIIFKNWVE